MRDATLTRSTAKMLNTPAKELKAIAQSPKDPAFVQDPYPFYGRARAHGELVHWTDYDMPVAFSHRAVSILLKDRRFGRMPPNDVAPEGLPDHLADFRRTEAYSLLDLDGPAHVRLRRLVVAPFSTARATDLAPMIEATAAELVDDLPAGPFDLIAAFAEKLPIKVISKIIGVPDAMGPQLLAWSHAMVAMYQAGRTHADEVAANDAAAAFYAYLNGFLDDRLAAPDGALASELVARDRADALERDELISLLVLLLNAGHEATVHSIGNAVYTLLAQDQPFGVARPGALGQTVDEVLRFDPPLHMFHRYALEDVELCGFRIPRGQKIGASLGAANRDPAQWRDPDGFDVTRQASPLISFGAGPHFCLGAPLARLELEIAIKALFNPDLNLRLVEQPRYNDTYHFHGLTRLMVEKSG